MYNLYIEITTVVIITYKGGGGGGVGREPGNEANEFVL